MSDDINPDLKQVLASYCDWIEQVTELAADDNWQAVHRAVNDLEDGQLRGMIYVLLLARGGDLRQMRQLAANWDPAPLN